MKEYKVPDEALNEVRLKMGELLKVCQIYKIPMFTTVAIKNIDETATEYERYVYSAKTYHIELSNDQIERHVLVANGFIPSPPRENIEMDMDDFLLKNETEEE